MKVEIGRGPFNPSGEERQGRGPPKTPGGDADGAGAALEGGGLLVFDIDRDGDWTGDWGYGWRVWVQLET